MRKLGGNEKSMMKKIQVEGYTTNRKSEKDRCWNCVENFSFRDQE
jgi:hypothetical protein